MIPAVNTVKIGNIDISSRCPDHFDQSSVEKRTKSMEVSPGESVQTGGLKFPVPL